MGLLQRRWRGEEGKGWKGRGQEGGKGREWGKKGRGTSGFNFP